jgi:multidrug transporter EmrE-like cation transporter
MVVSALKIVAIVLIVAGIAGLVYGKFTYTKATHEMKLGPMDLSVKEKQTVNVPLWAGIAAIAAGIVLLVVPKRT